jgi:predicted enzyme related to lactoylglutathione lyase
MHGTFCWNELMTTNPEAAEAFYCGLAGWEVETMPMPDGGTYRVMKRDGKPIGGIMGMPATMPPGVPSHWGSYLAVDDVDATVRQAVELGGKVYREPFEVPEVGRIAVIGDPTGAVLNLLTPVQQG